MEESEKMNVLKKAYADMILNTTKEAATKIMKSERKGHRFHHDLSSMKDEALRLLFQLKQTMDFKLNDLEMKSQNQQSRIEELEAQLQEAQDIVGNQQVINLYGQLNDLEMKSKNQQRRIEELEAQLQEAQDIASNQQVIKMYCQLNDLEMKSQNQQRRSEELEAQLQEAEDIVGNLRAELHEAHMRLEKLEKNQMHYRPSMMEKTVCEEGMAEPENELCEAVLASQSKGLNNSVNGHCIANNSLGEYGCAGVPDFPSMTVRSQKSELYRNGCTQRVQAYEGNLLNGHFSLSSELDDLKNEKALIEEKEGKRINTNPSIEASITCIAGEIPVDIKEVKYVDRSSCNDRAKKSSTRYIGNNALVLKLVHPVSKEASSNVSNLQTCLSGSLDELESLNDEDKGMSCVSPLTTPSVVFEMGSLSEHVAVVQGGDELAEACIDALDEDREVANNLVLIRQQNGSRHCLDVPKSNLETEMKNVSSTSSEPKVLDTCEGFPSLLPRERVLKYTFQRKRKKAALSSDDSNLLPQENPSKRKMGKKQDGGLKPSLSSMVARSSRDSRRMAEVARQLISLSEKKW